MLFCQSLVENNKTFLIEQKLIGQVFSLMGFCDGRRIIQMPIVQDHKRAFVDDKGPNTGGMGSYSDADHRLPFLTTAEVEQALHINQAVLKALSTETKDKYIGVLYGSFIATPRGIYVIEFNVRFGDPEALNVLTILQSDFVNLCQALVTGALSVEQVKFSSHATVCKYTVPEGYPDEPVNAMPIDIAAVKNKAQLYLASVNVLNGKMFTTTSRTAAYVGIADSISAAEEIAEREICGVTGPLFHREDIGTDLCIQSRIDLMRKWRNV